MEATFIRHGHTLYGDRIAVRVQYINRGGHFFAKNPLPQRFTTANVVNSSCGTIREVSCLTLAPVALVFILLSAKASTLSLIATPIGV